MMDHFLTFQYLSPLVGFILYWPAWRALRKLPTLAGWLAFLSGGSGTLFFALMPTVNARSVDHLLHMVGVGRLMVDVLGTLAVASTFAFICVSTERWSHWRTVALGVYGALIAVVVVLWGLSHLTPGGSAFGLYYHGYGSHPLPLLAMNLISGLCTLYVGILATSQYYQPFVEAETAWERVSASAAIVLYASVAVYGVGVMAETATGNATWVSALRSPLFTLTAILALVFPWMNGFLLPLWRRLRLAQLLESLQQCVVLITELLNQIFGDPDTLRAVEVRCKEQDINEFWTKVALMATRMVTASRSNRMKAMVEKEGAVVDDQPMLTDIPRWSQESGRTLVEACCVAVLVAPHLRSPDLKLRGPLASRGMRRKVANLIAAELYTRSEERRIAPVGASMLRVLPSKQGESDRAATARQ
jgi:hypothetical protein